MTRVGVFWSISCLSCLTSAGVQVFPLFDGVLAIFPLLDGNTSSIIVRVSADEPANRVEDVSDKVIAIKLNAAL